MSQDAAPLAPELTGAAQRRRLSILFCDLAGSTELANRLDPEDFHGLIHRYLDACNRCVGEVGGYVARYMGDGILAYFGYPAAREDDPQRAVTAALRLRDEVARLDSLSGAPLSVRCGIATGQTIVGDLIGSGAAQERMVVGQAAILAARFQAAATPGGVLICEATRDALGGAFELEPVGPLPLKGFAEPVAAWSVAGPAAPAARAGRALRLEAPFVGRTAELEALEAAWARAASAGLQVVSLTGDAGIGKSRLLAEFQRRLGLSPESRLQGATAQMFANTPLHAVSQLILGRVAVGAGTWPAGARRRLRAWLKAAGVGGDDAYPLVADLIELATPDEDSPLPFSAEERRARLLERLADLFLGSARHAPAVLVLEDLHWADPSTLELLELIVARGGAARLLVVLTSRVPLTTPGGADGRLDLRLEPLDPAAARQLVETVSGGRLGAALVDGVVARAEGVPLFAEELARLMGAGDGRADEPIPPTLAGLLTARLDQAGPAKALAQMASVLGPEFDPAVLAAICARPVEDLAGDLDQLRALGVFAPEGDAPDVVAFRHALIRDVAYDAILKGPRRVLHRRAAEALQAERPSLAAAHPEILAQHWAEAGDPARALEAWSAAGHAAFGRRAFQEAQHAFEAAMGALASAPDAEPRELELQAALASLLQITRGYSAPETMQATARARTLAERNGDLDRQVGQLANGWIAASSAGRYAEAVDIGARLMPLAIADGRPERVGVAAMMQMTSRYRMGDLHGAEEVFLGARRAFARSGFQRQPGAVPQTLGNAAINAWLLGKPAEARRRLARAVAIAERKDEPYERAFTSFMAATAELLMEAPAAAEQAALEALDLADRFSFPQFSATSRIVLGAARSRLGRDEGSVELIREGLAGMAVTSSRAGVTMYLTWLAEALWSRGERDRALASLEQALREGGEERFFRPEVLRTLALFRQASGDGGRARDDCAQAMAAAKAMGARTLHRRALATLRALGA